MIMSDGLRSPREIYPGLDELDYCSINCPDIGIIFYRIVAQLPEEMKVKLMKKEAKERFCRNIHYVYDMEYITEKLEEITMVADFNPEESKMFMKAIKTIFPCTWLIVIANRFREALARI